MWSRSGLSDQTTEAALAAAVLDDGGFERGAVEVRPVGRHEHQFAVRGLPEKKIRKPLLAAGADNDIGIGHVRSVKVARQQLGRNSVGRKLTLRYFSGETAGSARDLLARAVIKRDDQRESRVVARQIFRFLQQETDVAVERLPLADDTHPHIALMQVGKIVANEAAQQHQKILDLGLGPRPIFRAEREDGQIRNAEVARRTHGPAQSFHSAPVSFHPRQAARRRPAPIAIHNDGNVPRHSKAVAISPQRLRCPLLRSYGITQTVMISFSLPASIFSTSAIEASVAFCTSADWRS